MRIRWWKSIRWQLALGSVFIVLVATLLLALTVLVAVRYNYADEQLRHLEVFTGEKAQTLGANYAYSMAQLREGNGPQANASSSSDTMVKQAWLRALSSSMRTTGVTRQAIPQNSSLYIIDTHDTIIYPLPLQRNTTQAIDHLAGPAYSTADQQTLVNAINKALKQGTVTNGELDHHLLRDVSLPFSVVPIFSDDQNSTNHTPIGAVVATAQTGFALSFLSTVGNAVICATLVIIAIAAIGAILFARTITKPITKLSQASRILAAGDYSAHVSTAAPGEIGELALSFNDMATQLKCDVDELHRQEMWRRELIMNITHDLATPLTAIAGLGEALVDGVGQSREDYEATGRIIMHETLRLRRLVQDLHVMAKVEAGALAPKKKPVRLASLVDQVFATMITEFERHQVEPINEIPYNLSPIEADPDMLTRVFANLCSNALRHTPPGGSLFIRAHLHSDDIVISVVDTGEGIPVEALTRIFERFYRADNARQSTTGGSGLGLAIVQAIVASHGGRIWAENNPTGGACISFSLPVTQNKAQTLENVSATPLQSI